MALISPAHAKNNFRIHPRLLSKTIAGCCQNIDSPESIESMNHLAGFPFEFWGSGEFSLIPNWKYFQRKAP